MLQKDVSMTGVVSGTVWVLISCGIAYRIAISGFRKNSLSKAGALAAFCVGALHLGCGLRFGTTLVAFYLSSSKLTKWKSHIKAKLEDDFKPGGQRSAAQVLANSAGGTVLALLYISLGGVNTNVRSALGQLFLAGFLGHYACCCADTWSSEVGIVSRAKPRLVTSWKEVPRGTNGGVTLLGSAAGAAGGLAMGVVFWLAEAAELMCSGRQTGLHSTAVWLGLAAGLLGTTLDSLLGATLQFTGYSQERQVVVSKPGTGVQHVSGIDVLSNNSVNILAAGVTSFAAPALLHAANSILST